MQQSGLQLEWAKSGTASATQEAVRGVGQMQAPALGQLLSSAHAAEAADAAVAFLAVPVGPDPLFVAAVREVRNRPHTS